VAAAGNGEIDFNQVSKNQYATTVISPPLSLAVSPNGQTLAVGYQGGWVDLWDADKVLGSRDFQLVNINAHAGDVESLGFSPDSSLLASTEYGATKVWDVPSGGQKYVINHDLGFGSGVTETAFSHDGKSLAICSGAMKCGFWQLDDGKPITTLDSKSYVTKDVGKVLAVGFSADDQTFATGWSDGSIWLWKDGKLDSTLRSDPGDARVTAMTFSPDLNRVAVGLSDGNVQILRLP
jgi:WD40 repeat protein